MSKSRRPPSRTRKHSSSHKANLPETTVVVITSITEEGELVASPVDWNPRQKPPHIVVIESGRSQAATVGDKVLVKLKRLKPHFYQGLAIKLLATETPHPIIGMLVMTADGGIIEPISRKEKQSFMVAKADLNGAQHGELVSAMTLPGTPSLSMTYAKITERLGSLGSPKAASLIATHMHELRTVFPTEVLAEAQAADIPLLDDKRTDLREIPLVTIDGADARDFDDAVYAKAVDGGFELMVAIADVAYYVTPDSALDHEAYLRGNSTYFPDRVLPMLPERLSNGLCSLNPGEDRYCLVVRMAIDHHGNIQEYEFVRGLMRSAARLTYEQMELAQKDKKNKEFPMLPALWAAYASLAKERDQRGALDLNLPEYVVHFDASGNVANIAPKARLESHRLIECFMIAANVCAADFLIKKHAAGIYRVHESPSEEKITELRDMLKMSGYGLAKGNVLAKHLNHALHKAEGKPNAYMINMSVLRAQMQAYYGAENLGHFGLALAKYCHFTSPIRRYSDLVVHRSLCAQLDKGQTPVAKKGLPQIAVHISETERKSMMAERDASDRYKVSYMARQVGNVFTGTIAGLSEHGLYVALAENGIQGFIPVRFLGQDFFMYDKRQACFRGRRTNKVYQLGDAMMVRVEEANAVTASLLFVPADSPKNNMSRGNKKPPFKGKKKKPR